MQLKLNKFKAWYKTANHKHPDLKALAPFIQAMRTSFILGLEKASQAKFKKETSDLNVPDEFLLDLNSAFEAGLKDSELEGSV